MSRASWRPTLPEGTILRIVADSGGVDERVVWMGFVNVSGSPTAETIQVSGRTAESVIEDFPLPYSPPGIVDASEAPRFEYWWRNLAYVFDLPDPRSFEGLSNPLDSQEQELVSRFIAIAHDLGDSSALRSGSSVSTFQEDEHSDIQVTRSFPPLDHQAGFAALLRQAYVPSERASFRAVRNVVSRAASLAEDPLRNKLLMDLKSWKRADSALRKRSVEQLVRDNLVKREGWLGLAYDEPMSPHQLIERYNYGDLIHWGNEANSPDELDEASAALERFEFLQAAAGLAYLYVGFAELLKRAVST